MSVSRLTQDSFAPFGTVINDLPADVIDEETPGRKGAVLANQGSAIKWAHVTHLTNHYDDIAPSGVKGRTSVSLFHCMPRTLRDDLDVSSRVRASLSKPNQDDPDSPETDRDVSRAVRGGVFDIEILERHPFTSQTFVPMGLSAFDYSDTCYLVIVAPTLPQHEDRPSGPPSRSPPKGTGPPDVRNMQAFLARGDQAVTYAAGTWHAPMVVVGRFPVDFVVWQFANDVSNEDCQEMKLEPQGKEFDGPLVLVPPAEERATILRLRHSIGSVKL